MNPEGRDEVITAGRTIDTYGRDSGAPALRTRIGIHCGVAQ
jgi:hypothetical protein